MSLAQSATADAGAGGADAGGADSADTADRDSWHELRAFHAEQLQDEMRRLCGTDPSGEVPSSCTIDYSETDLPHPGDSEELLSRTVAAAEKVPEESVDLVVAQAIDALALEPVTLDPVGQKDEEGISTVTGETDLEAVRTMLAEENAFAYGLDIALAHGDSDLRKHIAALKKSSDERVRALGRLVGPEHPDWIMPAPGYEFTPGHSQPTNAGEAAALAHSLTDRMVEKWRAAAAHAQSAAWREDAIRLAAHAQRRPE